MGMLTSDAILMVGVRRAWGRTPSGRMRGVLFLMRMGAEGHWWRVYTGVGGK